MWVSERVSESVSQSFGQWLASSLTDSQYTIQLFCQDILSTIGVLCLCDLLPILAEIRTKSKTQLRRIADDNLINLRCFCIKYYIIYMAFCCFLVFPFDRDRDLCLLPKINNKPSTIYKLNVYEPYALQRKQTFSNRTLNVKYSGDFIVCIYTHRHTYIYRHMSYILRYYISYYEL